MSARGRLLPEAVAVFSDKGGRVCQEDHCYVNEKKGVFVVADGFGGPEAGFNAAKNACEAVRQFVEKEAGDLEATLPFVLRSYYTLIGNVLFNALVHANRRLLKENKKKNVHEKGGASIVAGYIQGNDLALVNAGVCSAAIIRNGRIRELALPRSYQRYLDPFVSTLEPMGSTGRGDQAIPLMAIGMAEDLEPEVFECRIQKGDWIALFSDGMTPEVFENLAVLNKAGLDPQQSAEEAVNLFNLSKYTDNASIVLAIF